MSREETPPKPEEPPYDMRLSFRSYERYMPKLELIARARNFVIQRTGRPNISAVLNYLIDRFDASEEAKIVKKMDAEKKEKP